MRGMINLLGPLFTRAFKPGASEVKAARLVSVDDSTTRATIATPASGKKIRIIALQVWTDSTTAAVVEVYFDTGTNITSNAGNEIAEPRLDLDDFSHFDMVWPDGGGPVGGADEVVSLRTTANITVAVRIIIHYREE